MLLLVIAAGAIGALFGIALRCGPVRSPWKVAAFSTLMGVVCGLLVHAARAL